MLNHEPMGKNSCVTFPCLIQLPPLKTAADSWGSYGWEWSVAGLSVLAHMHTLPTVDFTMEKETTAITPADILPHSLDAGVETLTHSPLHRPHDCLFLLTQGPLSIHPRT